MVITAYSEHAVSFCKAECSDSATPVVTLFDSCHRTRDLNGLVARVTEHDSVGRYCIRDITQLHLFSSVVIYPTIDR